MERERDELMDGWRERDAWMEGRRERERDERTCDFYTLCFDI